MRTLKKTLCLVLALVMCLGLMSTAFASQVDTFPDVASVDQIEAADYLVAAGVIEGTTNGLEPDAKFTRAQAAKLIAYMMLGKVNAENYRITGEAFDDVSVDHWAAKYIQYCSVEGYIKGDGDGKFMPEDNVTGLQFAAMLLRALGYDANGELSVNWPYSTQALALSVNLFGGVLSAASNDELDRDTAMQMQFNAMTAVATVQYNASYALYFTGTQFTQNQGYKKGDAGFDSTNTLGYKNFDLVSKQIVSDLGYPMREWMNRRTGVVVTNQYPDYTVVNVTVAPNTNPKTLAKSLELAVTGYDNDKKPNKFTADIRVNGVKLGAATPGNGETAAVEQVNTTKDDADATTAMARAVIQAVKDGYNYDLIDTDDNGIADRVIIVVEFVATVTRTTAAKGTNPATAEITVKKANDTADDVKIVLSEEYFTISGLVKDDILVVIPPLKALNSVVIDSNFDVNGLDPDVKGSTNGSEDAVIEVEARTPVESAVTSFNGVESKGNPTSVTFGGNTYNYSKVEATTKPFVGQNGYKFGGSTYDFYFNSAGFIIGATEHKVVDSIPNVIYVTAVESKKDDSLFTGSGYAAKVKGYLVDGNEVTFDLKVEQAKESITGGTTPIDPKDPSQGTVNVYKTVEAEEASTTGTDATIAKNGYYVAVGKRDYYKIETSITTKTDGTIVGNVFAYETDDKGYTTLDPLPKTLSSGVTYAGEALGVGEYLELSKDKAVVTMNVPVAPQAGGPPPAEEDDADVTTTNLYATTNTNLVIVDGRGNAKTVTGYGNFPSGSEGKATKYEVAAPGAGPLGENEVKAIFYVTTESANDPKKTLTDIVVIGRDEAPEAQMMLLAYTGEWRTTTNAEGKEITELQFVNAANGETVYYPVAKDAIGKTADKNSVYAGTLDRGEFKPEKLSDPLEVLQLVPGAWVRVDYTIDEKNSDASEAQDAKVKGDVGTVLYLNGVTPYELSDGYPTANLTARAVAIPGQGDDDDVAAVPGSKVYILYNTKHGPDENKIIAMFVWDPTDTDHAPIYTPPAPPEEGEEDGGE